MGNLAMAFAMISDHNHAVQYIGQGVKWLAPKDTPQYVEVPETYNTCVVVPEDNGARNQLLDDAQDDVIYQGRLCRARAIGDRVCVARWLCACNASPSYFTLGRPSVLSVVCPSAGSGAKS